jgi:hypothetical protein
MAFEFTVDAVTQVRLEVSLHFTVSPLLRLVVVNVLPPPADKPFTVQSKVGDDPPLFMVEEKVTDPPVHIAPDGVAEIVIEGVTLFVTVITTELEVAVEGNAQAALEVSTQVKASPFAMELVEYAAEVAPLIFTPFFLH